jgi:hypothetical protein
LLPLLLFPLLLPPPALRLLLCAGCFGCCTCCCKLSVPSKREHLSVVIHRRGSKTNEAGVILKKSRNDKKENL